MVDILTQKNALEQLTKLKADKFIGELQFRCLKDLLKSDERAFFCRASRLSLLNR